MSVPIDSSRAYRWPSELIELVEAVTRADPHNESTWIEWKSTLDLTDKAGQHHVAKHVLGFANRTLTTANLHAGGLAYLIVGAEPGNLGGIAPLDPAELRPKIDRYVGPAVRWHAEFLTVQQKPVLVVVVEPPLNGDPIHPVRRQLDIHPAGRILVRRQGSTDPANDFEIDQLVQRVRAGQHRLEFSIEPISAAIEADPGPLNADDLTAAERAATIARPRADSADLDGDAIGMLGAGVRNKAWLAAAFQDPDFRSDEEYANEIDEYCAAYHQAIQELSWWRLWRHRPAWLQLTAVNLTEDNFTDIEIELHIAGDVLSWPDELQDIGRGDQPVLPRRPAVLGTPTVLQLMDSDTDSPGFALLRPEVYGEALGLTGPTVIVRDSGSVTISFANIDLRPKQRFPLPKARLLVDAPTGTALICTWKATASNVRGQQAGSFNLIVSPSTLHIDVTDIDRERDDATED